MCVLHGCIVYAKRESVSDKRGDSETIKLISVNLSKICGLLYIFYMYLFFVNKK